MRSSYSMVVYKVLTLKVEIDLDLDIDFVC